jgi:hypothetical protein
MNVEEALAGAAPQKAPGSFEKVKPMAVKVQETPLSRFISKRLDQLAPRKSQRQVAQEAGFKALNIVNMMKNGVSKLPIDRVPAMAKALEVDPSVLLRLALNEFMGGNALKAIDQMLGTIVSQNEVEILEFIREVSGNSDPSLTDAAREQLKTAFGS